MYLPFFDLVSDAALNVERASSYCCGWTSISYSPYIPSRVTFSATIVVLEKKAGGSASAGGGTTVKAELAMVKAANAPAAALGKSKTGRAALEPVSFQ